MPVRSAIHRSACDGPLFAGLIHACLLAPLSTPRALPPSHPAEAHRLPDSGERKSGVGRRVGVPCQQGFEGSRPTIPRCQRDQCQTKQDQNERTGARRRPAELGRCRRIRSRCRTAPSAGQCARGTGADWFGPLNPLSPIAPPDVAGRRFDFPPGYNLVTRPRAYEPIGFHELRGFADAYDLLRLVIETRKDQMERQRWRIRPRDPVHLPR